MRRKCEICENLAAWSGSGSTTEPARTRGVLIEDRILAVCDAHADAIAAADCTTLSELRELFPEPDGYRSLVPRRAALDRRVFPPRPEGRRLPSGRRAGDAVD